MALNFGQGSAGLFPTSQAAGVGYRSVTNLETRREEQPILPDVAHGEIVLWEKGLGIYDDYNSSLDLTKWTKVETLGTVTETASTIDVELNIGAGAGGFNESVETKDLPELADMSEVSFRLVTDLQSSSAGDFIRTIIFGKSYMPSSTPPGAGSDEDKTWMLIKRDDGDWNIFKDDVFFDTITATNNIIKIQTIGDFGGNAYHVDRSLFEITVDGGTFLLTRTTNNDLYAATMVKIE